MTAHTTNFIVNGSDYFAANLDNGGVRIGLVGEFAYDFPVGHAKFARAAALACENDVEAMVDESFCEYGPAVVII